MISDYASEFEKEGIICVAVGFDPPENLKKMEKYSSILISDYPSHAIINAYKANQLFPPIFDRKANKSELALTISYLINSKGIIVWKFRKKDILNPYLSRPKMSDVFQAIKYYLKDQ